MGNNYKRTTNNSNKPTGSTSNSQQTGNANNLPPPKSQPERSNQRNKKAKLDSPDSGNNQTFNMNQNSEGQLNTQQPVQYSQAHLQTKGQENAEVQRTDALNNGHVTDFPPDHNNTEMESDDQINKETSNDPNANPGSQSTEMEMDKDKPDFEIKKTDEFSAAIHAQHIKGKSLSKKHELLGNLLREKFGPAFTKTGRKTIKNKENYIIAYFNNNTALEQAKQIEFKAAEDAPAAKLVPWTDIKPPISEDVKNDRNNCTIKVIDIPLDVKAPTVRANFRFYGAIDESAPSKGLKMITRGAFQHAYITFVS